MAVMTKGERNAKRVADRAAVKAKAEKDAAYEAMRKERNDRLRAGVTAKLTAEGTLLQRLQTLTDDELLVATGDEVNPFVRELERRFSLLRDDPRQLSQAG